MKKIIISLFSLFFLGLAVLAVIGAWGAREYLSSGPLDETKYVVIERGAGISAIATKLGEENVISNPFLFKFIARVRFAGFFGGSSLKAGEYQFEPNATMVYVMDKMEDGEVFERKITIPEGLTSYQIVELLNKNQDLSGEITAIPAEGSLLPDTYLFGKNKDRQALIKDMQNAMQKVIDELWETRQADLPIKSKREALILASIVEKETGVNDERTKVAGVFVNRLKKGMMLQTDPTVIYALTKGKIQNKGKGPLGRRLLLKDLRVDSPYNTYKVVGLPPGAIANPGRKAIAATLNPEAHNYIFFVADGTGGHAFAKDLAGHNANVAKWRKIRSAQ